MTSPRRIKVTRNTLLFIVGVAGVAHETLLSSVDRPTLLLLFAACLGLPAFLPDRPNPPPPKDSAP
jgi:hypothetical protein